MRINACCIVVLFSLVVSCRTSSAQAVSLERLDQTARIELTGGFIFSISPNDQWLVFFRQADPLDPPATPAIHGLYGHLRVLNLRSGETHAFTLREDQVSDSINEPERGCWAPDSTLCVLPPHTNDRKVVIRFGEGDKPTISFAPDMRRPQAPGASAPAQPNMPEKFTCSDCLSREGDIDLLKKHIPKEFQFGGTVTAGSSTEVVSADGKKIYYQQGPQGKRGTPAGYRETTLYEVDLATGKERMLISHHGDSPMIDRLRPSPDGKKLAYQVTTGGNFLSTPEIYVLDLASAKAESIALGSGTMHWTSNSDRLFFYRRWDEGAHGDYLWYAEFPKAPAVTTRSNTTAPEAPPATAPARP